MEVFLVIPYEHVKNNDIIKIKYGIKHSWGFLDSVENFKIKYHPDGQIRLVFNIKLNNKKE